MQGLPLCASGCAVANRRRRLPLWSFGRASARLRARAGARIEFLVQLALPALYQGSAVLLLSTLAAHAAPGAVAVYQNARGAARSARRPGGWPVPLASRCPPRHPFPTQPATPATTRIAFPTTLHTEVST